MQAETHPEADGALDGVLLSVGLVGGVLALVGGGVAGLEVGASVGLGAALGGLNLWVLGRVVRAFLGGRIGAWGLVALLKFGALFGGLWALLRSGVPALPLIFGFAAVPLGIVAAQLRGAPLPRSGG